MPTDGVLHSAHQFRRFGYHLRVILRVFTVIAYALARVCSSLLTPVIAHWSRGRGLFRKATHSRGKFVSSDARVRWEPSKLRAVRPTLGAFLRAGLGLELHSWPQRTDKVFVIQWTFGPVSFPPDNKLVLNNIKKIWTGLFSYISYRLFLNPTSHKIFEKY